WRASRRRSAAPRFSPVTSWRSTPAGISRCSRSKLASWAKRGLTSASPALTSSSSELFAERTQGRTDPDDAPEPPAHPVAEPGDLWVLDRHRLLCGDSTVATDVERVLGGVAPHLMVTDPPYGVNYDPAWRNQAGRSINGTTQRIATGTVIKPIGARAVGKVVNDDRADWREAWALFPGSVAYIWHAGTKAGIVQDSLAACGFETRSQIIWAKNNFAIGRGHYHCKHEPCWYVVRKGSTASWVGDHCQTTLWQIDKNLKSET